MSLEIQTVPAGQSRHEFASAPVVNTCDGLAEILRLATQSDAISFDVFDTLFTRPICSPEDLFDILGAKFGLPDFRAMRLQAQTKAFQRMSADCRNEITLDAIYACLGNCTPASADTLKHAEYELELALTLPNPGVVAVFLDLLSKGHRVVLTSDMYLPEVFFSDLLQRHGLPNVPLFISSARDATKRDRGDLFAVVARELQLAPSRILHIGDNPHSDIEMAVAKGFQAYLYQDKRFVGISTGHAASASLATALIKIHGDYLPPGSFRELGFRFGGPGAVGFLEWIRQRSAVDGIDMLLFVSRDGYILDKLARTDPDANDPPLVYFKGSRTVFTLASINEHNFTDYLDFILSGSHGLAPSEILERIGVTPPADKIMGDLGLGRSVVVTDNLMPLLRNFLVAYRWEILKVCRRNRSGLFRYLLELGVRPGMRLGFVDVGWNATTQDALHHALLDLFAIYLKGYYFCLLNSPECQRRSKYLDMEAMISAANVSGKLLDLIYENRVVIESFFSAPHCSVIGYELSPGGKVAAIEDIGRGDTRDLSYTAAELSTGIQEFAHSFRSICRAAGFTPNPLDTIWPLIEFSTGGTANLSALGSVKNFDAWGSSRNRDMLLRDYTSEEVKMEATRPNDNSTNLPDVCHQHTALPIIHAQKNGNAQMVKLVDKAPSAQNILDIFAGDWTSQMPHGSRLTSTGNIPLFEDDRIAWLQQLLGPVDEKDILELGPLEGAHTYALHQLGARSITSIEANPQAFLRCLCIKEIFNLNRAHFLLGNFIGFFEKSAPKVDIIVASGVLYHMTDPLYLLELLCRTTDRIFIWSHYYDGAVIRARSDASIFAPIALIQRGEYRCEASIRTYPDEALAWQGFTGGAARHAVWLTRAGLLGFLSHQGFTSIEVGFDQPHHPNGPALALCAKRA